MYKLTHVDGKNFGKVVLYALSACGWCKKTKKLLNSYNVAYDYVDVDLLDEKDGDEIDRIVNKWNPKGTYPTIVINDQRSINGYNEESLKKEFGK